MLVCALREPGKVERVIALVCVGFRLCAPGSIILE